MKRASWLLLLVCAAAAWSPASNAWGVSYQYDNGTPSVVVGWASDATMLWGNVFTVQPGGEKITSLSYMFGLIPADTTFHALLYAGCWAICGSGAWPPDDRTVAADVPVDQGPA